MASDLLWSNTGGRTAVQMFGPEKSLGTGNLGMAVEMISNHSLLFDCSARSNRLKFDNGSPPTETSTGMAVNMLPQAEVPDQAHCADTNALKFLTGSSGSFHTPTILNAVIMELGYSEAQTIELIDSLNQTAKTVQAKDLSGSLIRDTRLGSIVSVRENDRHKVERPHYLESDDPLKALENALQPCYCGAATEMASPRVGRSSGFIGPPWTSTLIGGTSVGAIGDADYDLQPVHADAADFNTDDTKSNPSSELERWIRWCSLPADLNLNDTELGYMMTLKAPNSSTIPMGEFGQQCASCSKICHQQSAMLTAGSMPILDPGGFVMSGSPPPHMLRCQQNAPISAQHAAETLNESQWKHLEPSGALPIDPNVSVFKKGGIRDARPTRSFMEQKQSVRSSSYAAGTPKSQVGRGLSSNEVDDDLDYLRLHREGHRMGGQFKSSKLSVKLPCPREHYRPGEAREFYQNLNSSSTQAAQLNRNPELEQMRLSEIARLKDVRLADVPSTIREMPFMNALMILASTDSCQADEEPTPKEQASRLRTTMELDGNRGNAPFSSGTLTPVDEECCYNLYPEMHQVGLSHKVPHCTNADDGITSATTSATSKCGFSQTSEIPTKSGEASILMESFRCGDSSLAGRSPLIGATPLELSNELATVETAFDSSSFDPKVSILQKRQDLMDVLFTNFGHHHMSLKIPPNPGFYASHDPRSVDSGNRAGDNSVMKEGRNSSAQETEMPHSSAKRDSCRGDKSMVKARRASSFPKFPPGGRSEQRRLEEASLYTSSQTYSEAQRGPLPSTAAINQPRSSKSGEMDNSVRIQNHQRVGLTQETNTTRADIRHAPQVDDRILCTPRPRAANKSSGRKADPDGQAKAKACETVVGKQIDTFDIGQKLASIGADAYGSSLLISRWAMSSAEDFDIAVRSLQPHFIKLAQEPHGSNVVQHILTIGTKEHRSLIIGELTEDALRLALHVNGCRLLQKCLEVGTDEEKMKLGLCLQPHLTRCVEDPNGNHVIRKCIECLPSVQFIIDAFRGQATRVSLYCYGCRVIQKLIQEFGNDQRMDPILNELVQNLPCLIRDQYGNYVVQYMIQHGREEDCIAVASEVASKLLCFSSHKYASNVVEKCLEIDDSTTVVRDAAAAREKKGHNDQNRFGRRQAVNGDRILVKRYCQQIIVAAALERSFGGQPPVLAMVRDRYANYVVQRMLKEVTGDMLLALVTCLQNYVHYLKKFTYGKHIVGPLARARKSCVAASGSSSNNACSTSDSGESSPRCCSTEDPAESDEIFCVPDQVEDRDPIKKLYYHRQHLDEKCAVTVRTNNYGAVLCDFLVKS